MRLAVMSDLHLSDDTADCVHTGYWNFVRCLKFLNVCAVEHLIICGDIVETYGDPKRSRDLEVFGNLLKDAGFYNYKRCTFVPGNHDYQNWGNFTNRNPPSLRRILGSLNRLGEDGLYTDPFLKVVNNIAIIGLNTTSPDTWGGVVGELNGRQTRIFRRLLSSKKVVGKRLFVAMHHRPEDLSNEEEFLDALESSDVDIVFCGHEHENTCLQSGKPRTYCVGGYFSDDSLLLVDVDDTSCRCRWRKWSK